MIYLPVLGCGDISSLVGVWCVYYIHVHWPVVVSTCIYYVCWPSCPFKSLSVWLPAIFYGRHMIHHHTHECLYNKHKHHPVTILWSHVCSLLTVGPTSTTTAVSVYMYQCTCTHTTMCIFLHMNVCTICSIQISFDCLFKLQVFVVRDSMHECTVSQTPLVDNLMFMKHMSEHVWAVTGTWYPYLHGQLPTLKNFHFPVIMQGSALRSSQFGNSNQRDSFCKKVNEQLCEEMKLPLSS